jgi:hypothetical protein
MGAESKVEIIRGKSAKDAFHNAQDQARWESGSSYTGTIAEAAGYIMGTAMTKWDAEAQGWDAIYGTTRRVDKWGPALLVPILPVPKTRTTTVAVDLTDLVGTDWDTMKFWEEQRHRIQKAVRSTLRTGEGVVSVKTETGVAKTKAVVTTSKAPMVKQYVVFNRHGSLAGRFATLKEAKDWAVAKTVHPNYGSPPRYTIEQRTLRGDGPLVTVDLVYTKYTLKATAEVGVPDRSAATTEWVAAGVYSC